MIADDPANRRRRQVRDAQARKRAAMTDEERESEKQRKRDDYRAKLAAMDDDQLEEFRRTERERTRAWLERLSPEQRNARPRSKATNRARGAARGQRRRLRAMLEANDGSCDCCGRTIAPDRIGRDGRHVDHNHETGKLRGILCAGCNRDMVVVDDPGRLARLIAYKNTREGENG